MKEYDLYLPLSYNDGTSVEPAKIKALKQLLLEKFGGLTHFPQENEGLWKVGRVTFRDKVIIFRVLTDQGVEARKFFTQFKRRVKEDLSQEDVLIVERNVCTID